MKFKHIIGLMLVIPALVSAAGKLAQTPYTEQKVVFDFYLHEPAQINSALFWIRALMNPLMDDPYNYAPEFLDIVVVIHLGFVVFAVVGGVFISWWRWLIWLHLPALLWAVWVECSGGICPLTYLENWLRTKGAQRAYQGDFINTYIMPVLYPSILTRNVQFILALSVIVINITVYGSIFYKRYRK